jgi:hypothetical protein
MPLYVYKCPYHNEFEVLMRIKDRKEQITCIFLDDDFEPCANPAIIQVSAPSMQPDKHWNGTVTHSGKTVFSKSEFEEDNKYLVPATEGNVNAVRKKTVELQQERQDKHDRRVEHFVADQLRGVDISSDGATVTQQNRFQKMRHS